MQIIVMGMHRSGTSLVTRLVNMMGAWVASDGGTIGLNEENPKGFWERRDVVACNDAILSDLNCTWEDVAHWPETDNLPTLSAERNETIRTILLNMDGHRPWVMKDPRLGLTFPFWRPFLEVPLIIMVTRDPVEVALSLEARNPEMGIGVGLALWERYAIAMLRALRGLPVVRVAHADAIADPVGVTRTLFDTLNAQGVQGLRLPGDEEVSAFVAPSLYRSRASELDHDRLLTLWQRHVHALICGQAEISERDVLQTSFGSASALALYSKRLRDHHYWTEKNREMTAQREALEANTRVLEMQIRALEESCSASARTVDELRQEIAAIHNSRGWKLGRLIVKPFGGVK